MINATSECCIKDTIENCLSSLKVWSFTKVNTLLNVWFLVNSPTLENLVVLSLLSNVALKSSISIALFPIDWKKSVIGLFANNMSLDTSSPFTLTAISLTLSKSG